MKSILSGSNLPSTQDPSTPSNTPSTSSDDPSASSSSSSAHQSSSPEVVAQLAQDIYTNDLLKIFLLNISRFEFESRKDVVNIFNLILRRQIGTRWPTVDYLANREHIIWIALKGFVKYLFFFFLAFAHPFSSWDCSSAFLWDVQIRESGDCVEHGDDTEGDDET